MITKNCKICNKSFNTYPSRIKVGKGNFCSKKCNNQDKIGKNTWNKGKKVPSLKWTPERHELMKKVMIGNTFSKGYPAWNKGKKLSKEHIEKSRLSHVGLLVKEKNPNWRGGRPKCEVCGEQLIVYTAKRCVKHRVSEEQKKKLRESHLGKPSWNSGKKYEKIAGDKHWNYQGGITSENHKIRDSLEIKLWRESVFVRDNWTCEKCHRIGGILVAHHIRNFAEIKELRTSIKNGVTLCRSCHYRFHKLYKNKNNNLEQLKEFINQ